MISNLGPVAWVPLCLELNFLWYIWKEEFDRVSFLQDPCQTILYGSASLVIIGTTNIKIIIHILWMNSFPKLVRELLQRWDLPWISSGSQLILLTSVFYKLWWNIILICRVAVVERCVIDSYSVCARARMSSWPLITTWVILHNFVTLFAKCESCALYMSRLVW